MSDPTPSPTEICRTWWEQLDQQPGDRAALRRCDNVTAALMVPSTHWLSGQLSEHRFRNEHTAALAALLAHVKSTDTSLQLPEAMAQGDPPRVSTLRFRRILASADIDVLLTQLRRAITLLNGAVHLPSLVNALHYWRFNPTSKQDSRTVREWACAYYGKAPAAS